MEKGNTKKKSKNARLEDEIAQIDERIQRNEQELNKIKVFDNTKIREIYKKKQEELFNLQHGKMQSRSKSKLKKKGNIGGFSLEQHQHIKHRIDNLVTPCFNFLIDTIQDPEGAEAGIVEDFEFEVSFCEDLMNTDIELTDKVVLKVDNPHSTFGEYLPQIANFFLKDKDKVFLLCPEGTVLLKEYKIWETLLPFSNCKLKGYLPQCKLVNVGGWHETHEFTEREKMLKMKQERRLELQKQEERQLRKGIIILNTLNLVSSMYTEMKFTGFVLSNRINDDIDIIEGDNIIDTIYSELNFWMPLALTELVQSAYEGLPTQRVQQIRSESNSCIISKSKLESSFPWIESECSNTLENSDTKSTYGDGESGFKFVREEGRKNRCILFGYTQDNFKLSYYSKINSLDTTNVTDTINYLRSRNWIDDQTKAVMISRVIMSKEAGSFQVFLMSFEVVLDHVERSINQFVVTPMLDEPIVIIYSVLILIATVFMLFILIIDLLDYELFKKRMDSLRARLRSEIQSEDLLLEEEKEAFPASESVEDINVKAGNRDHVIEQMVERRIRWWKRLAFKFRSPNIFE